MDPYGATGTATPRLADPGLAVPVTPPSPGSAVPVTPPLAGPCTPVLAEPVSPPPLAADTISVASSTSGYHCHVHI